MIRFALSLALPVALSGALAGAAPAFAAGGGGHGAGQGEDAGPSNRVRASFTLQSDLDETSGVENEETENGEAGPRAIVIPTLSMPAFVDGQLSAYFFVNVRVIVAEGSDPWAVREKTHYIRDAMVRAGHRRSIADPEAPTRIDAELAREILNEALSELVDMRDIERIEFTNVDRAAG